jgi:hypothetical protein
MENLDDPDDPDDPDSAKADLVQQSLKPAEIWLAEIEKGLIPVQDFRTGRPKPPHSEYENKLYTKLRENARIADNERRTGANRYDWDVFENLWNEKVKDEEKRIGKLPENAPPMRRVYRKTGDMLKKHYISAGQIAMRGTHSPFISQVCRKRAIRYETEALPRRLAENPVEVNQPLQSILRRLTSSTSNRNCQIQFYCRDLCLSRMLLNVLE